MANDIFTHKGLDNHLDEIRLIALQPCADSTAPINFRIFHARLSDRPQYEALSYMWGSTENPRIIEIERKECRIGLNLWLAFQQLRHIEEERILWVDAVCINQVDTSERNHQVGLMSSIYSQAWKVIAWLGPETEYSSEAISFLTQIHSGSVPAAGCDRLEFKEKWEAVDHFCKMEYWGRLWIIQEIILASQAIFCCGQDTLRGNAFINSHELIVSCGRFRTWNLFGPGKFVGTMPARLLQLRSNATLSNQSFPPLVELIIRFGEAQCKGSRDKSLAFGVFPRTVVR
jgi:hypothetical protein